MSSRLTPHRHFATSRAALFAVSLLGAQGIAVAATLGPMLLMSGQGEPLKAEIEIVAIQPGEEDSLAASVAPRLVYERAQLPYPFAALATNLKIERRADGKQVILLTSTEPVSQDNLDLLIELQAGKQSMTRRYPVTLALRSGDTQANAVNTPTATAAAPAIAASTAPTQTAQPTQQAQPAPQAQAEPAAPPAKPAADVPAAKPAADATAAKPSRPIAVAAERPAEAAAAEKPSTGGKNKGRPDRSAAAGSTTKKTEANGMVVAPGDYLNKIIDQIDFAGATREQAKLAIYRANPKAFFGSVHQLRAGVPLIVPPATEMASIDQGTAVRELRAQTRRFTESLAAGGTAAGSAGTAASASAGEKGDRLSLSASKINETKGAPASMARRDESQAAVTNALKEANSRISDLQRNVNDLKALLALKDRQIAQATTAINLSRPAGTATSGAVKANDASVSAAPSPATAAVAAATAANATNNANASSTATNPAPAAADSTAPSAAGNNSATAPTASAEPKPVTSRPIPAAKPAIKNVAIEPESDGSMAWWLSIGAGVLALVGLGFLLRKYLAKREERRLDELESELAAENSIFKTQTRSAPITARV